MAARDKAQLNILVVRPDRIGDVVLSTPVFEVLKKHYPQSKLTVMVREGVAPLVRGIPFVDQVMIFDPEGRHSGTRGFFNLASEVRAGNFRIAVVLQSQWKIAAALFKARIKYRVGPLSKPHSFVFYNRGLRQRRASVEMHETDYNLQLLRKLGIRVGTRSIPTRLYVSDAARELARQWLLEHAWNQQKPLVVVHPGMGGSALNWPENHYIDFIRAIIKEGNQVLVTGGPTEGSILLRIQQELGALKERVMFYGGPSAGSIDDLAGLLSWSDLVVAPSTGPLHIAVALGKPVVSFYPPIRVQSALRWGPYLPDDSKASVLVPEIYCGEDFKCRGNVCNYFPCMKSLTVPQALEEARRLMLQNKDVQNV